MFDNINMIRGIDDSKPYWMRVSEYCVEGNLQAVMDEYIHVLFESLGLSGDEENDAMNTIAETISAAVSLRTARVDFDDITLKRNYAIGVENYSLRCRYALRFGEAKNDNGDEVTRSDQVRTAFNSPFKPFILATTSIGQEGLDFHQYCHSIYHWNLPANPVDLEQREGRIHRYKGHVIRKNVARKFKINIAQHKTNDIKDPWETVFELACKSRKKGENDLVPYWVCEIEDGYKVERHVPVLPLSRDRNHYINLKKTMAAYRMVLGQARQEDLVGLIKDNLDENEIKEIINYRIDLSAI